MRIPFFALFFASLFLFPAPHCFAIDLASKPDSMSISLPEEWQESKGKHPSLVFSAKKRHSLFAIYRTNVRSMEQANNKMSEELGIAAGQGYMFSSGVQEETLAYNSKFCGIYYTGPKGDTHFRGYFQIEKKIYYFMSDNLAPDVSLTFMDQVVTSVLKQQEDLTRRANAMRYNPLTPDGFFYFSLQADDPLAAENFFNPQRLRLYSRKNPDYYVDINVARQKFSGEMKEMLVQSSQDLFARNPSCQVWKLERVILKTNNWEAYQLPYMCLEGNKGIQRYAYFIKAENSFLTAESYGLAPDVLNNLFNSGSPSQNVSYSLPQVPPYHAAVMPLATLPQPFQAAVDTLSDKQLKMLMGLAVLGLWLFIRVLFFGVRYLAVSATPNTAYPVYVDRSYFHLSTVFSSRIQGNRYTAVMARPAVTMIFFALIINTIASVAVMSGNFTGESFEIIKIAVNGAWALVGLGILGSFLYPKRLRLYDRHQNRLFHVKRTGFLPTYALKNQEGKTVCFFKKGFSFPYKRWTLCDLKGAPLVYVRERSVVKSIARRFLGHMFGFLRSSYYIYDGQNRNIGEMKRSPSIGNSYYVNITDRQWLGEPVFLNSCSLDEQVMLTFFIMLDTKAPDRIYPWYE